MFRGVRCASTRRFKCITFSSLITTSSVTDYSFCMLLFSKQIIVVPFNFTSWLKVQTAHNTASTVSNKFEIIILVWSAHNSLYTAEPHCNSVEIVSFSCATLLIDRIFFDHLEKVEPNQITLGPELGPWLPIPDKPYRLSFRYAIMQ